MNNAYKQQVKLLLELLPEVAKEICLAMHGGMTQMSAIRRMSSLIPDIRASAVTVLP